MKLGNGISLHRVLANSSPSPPLIASNDDGEHDEPFDATAVPRLFESDDSPSQRDVQYAMYGHGDGQQNDHVALFNTRRPSSLSFNELDYLRVQGQSKRAIRTLSGRHRLEIDEEYRIDHSDPNTVVASGPHFLDFVMYIGARRGMDAILPNIEVDQTWVMQLDLSTLHRLWPKSKTSRLPFDAHGRLLNIGRVGQEHVWVAMVPNEWLEEDHPSNGTGDWPVLPTRTTAMDTRHALMLIMFIAKMLADRRVQDFHCDPEYPDELTIRSVNDSSEIL